MSLVKEFINTDDSRWADFLSLTKHDIYHLPEYLEFSARQEGGEPLAFYMESASGQCLIPLLRKPMPDYLGTPYHFADLSSPYGYANPLYYPEDQHSLLAEGLSALKSYGRSTNAVSAFIRFHPLFEPPHKSLSNLGELISHGQTVYIDLSSSHEDIWRQTRKNHRVGIKNLLIEGFKVVINDMSYLEEFVRIYRQTMTRVGANDFYHFSDSYFDDLLSTMEGKFNLVCVLSPGGDLASGGLFSAYQGVIQFHLGGTHENYFEHAPTKLMFDYVRRWGIDRKYKTCHLGGGVGASADKLLHFKAGFSKKRGDFYTLRVVINDRMYQELSDVYKTCSDGFKENDNTYFPIYRGLPEKLKETFVSNG